MMKKLPQISLFQLQRWIQCKKKKKITNFLFHIEKVKRLMFRNRYKAHCSSRLIQRHTQ